ncbi:hypothetical protein [Christiangramia gaetbulicola]|uniref:hypothetical protein n=1 Tax=Christiangramia gaetbulicola TaxID=703340 RepID=UPI000D3D9279|nr:hypothetical protein [Christiangramia gaetbulicola]
MKEVFLIALVLLALGFTIKMFLHVLNSQLSVLAKIIWSLVILSTTLFGATLYFISDHGKSQS